MGSRGDLAEEFRAEAGAAFAFLVEDAGFSSPEQTDVGLRFRSVGLHVEVWFLEGREAMVTTLVTPVSSDGTRGRGVWLDELYVASGCGPAQDVPGSAPTRRATLKRVHQHAAALRRLMPQLLTAEGSAPSPSSRGLLRHTLYLEELTHRITVAWLDTAVRCGPAELQDLFITALALCQLDECGQDPLPVQM